MIFSFHSTFLLQETTTTIKRVIVFFQHKCAKLFFQSVCFYVNLNNVHHYNEHTGRGTDFILFLFFLSFIQTLKMSYNNYDNDNSVFICSRIFCCFSLGNKGKMLGVYFAGILVSSILRESFLSFVIKNKIKSIVRTRLVDFY